MLEALHWYGHSTFKIVAAGKVIYIDPYELPESAEKADVVFVTHEHFDHCSPGDIEKVTKKGTVVVAAAVCERELPDAKLVTPGEKFESAGIAVEVIAAYNTNKFREPGKVFHPKGEARVGYIFTLEGQRVYHAGDTDVIPEMAHLNVDVALLPVSGTYVMTAEEAAKAVKVLRPRLAAVPMHYGSIVGSADDAKKFAALCENICPVKILERVRA